MMGANKDSAVYGAKWMTISSLTTAVVSLLRISILTKFVDKEAFGIVAILTLVLGLTQTFADLGFSTSVMYKQNLSRKDFVSLYWIQLLIFALLYIVISSFSSLIARFYAEPLLRRLLPISLLDLIFYGIGRLHDTVLQKEFKFKILAIRNIIAAVSSLILAVILATLGFGVYSLVLSTIFQTMVNNIWNAIAGQQFYKLQFSMSVKDTIPLIKIGLYQTGTQIVDYLSTKLDILIIGKFLGTESLGVYSLAKELVIKVISIVNMIVNKVVLPFFSKFQNDDAELGALYKKVLRYLSLINFPICLLIGIFSVPVILILYGKGYSEVAPILSILSVWGVFLCIGNPVGNLAIAKGRTDMSFKYTIVRVIVTFPIVLLTSIHSLELVAWGQVLLSLILFFVGYKMLIFKMIRLSFREYLFSWGGVALLSILVGTICDMIYRINIIYIENEILQLLIYGCITLCIYLFVAQFFYKKDFLDLINIVRKK